MPTHPDSNDVGRTPAWRRYLRFWRNDTASDVRDELAFHLEASEAELVSHGMPLEDARREALARFGDVRRVTADCHALSLARERAMNRTATIDALRMDLRYALRQLRRSPLLTTVATLTLALGIGANTAIFSVVHAVMLARLPFAHADRLVLVSEKRPEMVEEVSVGNYVDWRTSSRSFEELAAYSVSSLNLTGHGEPQRLLGARVTANYFQVLSLPPIAGRYFLPDEDQEGAPHVVVLGETLWHTHFADDRSIIGRTIELNGQAHTVVGVAPRAYTLTPDDEQLYVPAAYTAAQRAQHDEHFLNVYGLLRPGVTAAQAEREMTPIAADLARRYPDTGTGDRVQVVALRDQIAGGYRTQLLVLLGAVGFVLLLACGNVANLLLARAAARGKEMALRSALGARPERIVRQLLTESVTLAVLGGVAGLVVAYFGIRFLQVLSPSDVPRLGNAGLDLPVLAFTLALTLLSGIVFGLAPALRSARSDLQATLKEGGRGTVGIGRDRLRSSLVVAEIAIALVLLVGAGLLIRSAREIQAQPPGVDPSNVLSFRLALTELGYRDSPAVTRGFERILESVKAVPGVQQAALVSATPFAGASQNGLEIEGRTKSLDDAINGTLRMVTPEYFTTLRIPLLSGRVFDEHDREGAPKVMIVNRTLARMAWPGEDPIGKRVGCCEGGPDTTGRFKTVVGVVADVRSWGLGADVQPEFYLPVAQAPTNAWSWINRAMAIVVRSNAPPGTLTKAAQRAVWSVDPSIPIYSVRTFDELIARSTAPSRFNMLLLTMLGVLGLVLAGVGIYGVIAYFVMQRVPEIGIRLALGATSGNVQVMVLRQGLVLALVGVSIGLGASLALTQLMRKLLFGVTPRDPLTFVATGALLAAVALFASWLPARRASRVAPIQALRG